VVIMGEDEDARGQVTESPERVLARRRIEKRRGLQGAMAAYVVVNGFLVLVWALTGRGYFWPAWVLGGWGVGMVLGAWDYWRGPVTDADVERELHRLHR
jgi:hypothetical protein